MKAMNTHGAQPLRGLRGTARSSIKGEARFGRMFRWLEPASIANSDEEEQEIKAMLGDIAGSMVTSEFVDNVKEKKFPNGPNFFPDAPIDRAEPADENPTIPAGYTYFGQFVDHDITFDPASFLQQKNDPNALVDFRTPRFDLDCLYGRGPADQPYLYQAPQRVKFALGTDCGIDGMVRPDLQRTQDHTALIGDKRNDENKIVAQVQALFLRFHNKVYDLLGDSYQPGEESDRFDRAQRIVRWSYQYVVLNDFLKRICKPEIYAKIAPGKDQRKPNLQFYTAHDDAFIPVEFSVAAYRFGHSMVRPSYKLNMTASSTAKFHSAGQVLDFARIPIFSVAQPHKNTDALNGFGEPLPQGWGIDWLFFFGKPGTHKDHTLQIPQPSYRIDSRLVDPLGQLPEFFDAKNKNAQPLASLAYRNLLRGHSMGLPSGQRIAAMMGFDPLGDDRLWEQKIDGGEEDWPEGKAILEKHGKWLTGSAPLWFYILKEAEMTQNGERLGDVGSTLVAETFFGLMWCDHYSYLFQMPHWNPGVEFPELHNLDMEKLTKFVG